MANDSGASTQGGQGELRWGNCRLTMSEGMPNVVVDDSGEQVEREFPILPFVCDARQAWPRAAEAAWALARRRHHLG